MKNQILKIIAKYTSQKVSELKSFKELNIDMMDLLLILEEVQDLLRKETYKNLSVTKDFHTRDTVRDLIIYIEGLKV